jgi:hypothetical protein
LYIYSAFENDENENENVALQSGVNRITISFSNTEQQKKKNTKKTEIKVSLSPFTRAKHALSRKETEEREGERERDF